MVWCTRYVHSNLCSISTPSKEPLKILRIGSGRCIIIPLGISFLSPILIPLRLYYFPSWCKCHCWDIPAVKPLASSGSVEELSFSAMSHPIYKWQFWIVGCREHFHLVNPRGPKLPPTLAHIFLKNDPLLAACFPVPGETCGRTEGGWFGHRRCWKGLKWGSKIHRNPCKIIFLSLRPIWDFKSVCMC